MASHPKAIGKIIGYGVENIIYISCKPTSLARDLEAFLQNGYRVERIRCVDMFPGTYHVETVVLLSNTDAKAAHPFDISHMTQEELNAELEKGYADIQAERDRPAEDVFADIRKDYDV